MSQMRTTNAVETLVEAMLPRFSGKLGLKFTLDVRWSRYDKATEESVSFRRDVTLLFMRECNYTKVFAQVAEFRSRDECAEWKGIGDHDSEWMSGVEMLLRNLEREAYDALGNQGVSTNVFFSLFDRPSYCTVEYELLPGQEMRSLGMYNVTVTKVDRKTAVGMMKERE